MKYTILMGSPNRDGNTAALLRPFVEENQEMGIEQDVIWLYERDIKPCRGCKACQNAKDCLGCPASRGETVEQACMVHGVDVNDLLAKVNEMIAAGE